jgi:hypothetical protein
LHFCRVSGDQVAAQPHRQAITQNFNRKRHDCSTIPTYRGYRQVLGIDGVHARVVSDTGSSRRPRRRPGRILRPKRSDDGAGSSMPDIFCMHTNRCVLFDGTGYHLRPRSPVPLPLSAVARPGGYRSPVHSKPD